MELAKQEFALVEQTAVVAHEESVKVLLDLQLALIGGGIGDTIL